MQNLNHNFLNQTDQLKSLCASVKSEIKNPLIDISSTCQTLISNLEEMIEMVYSVYHSSNRALLDLEIALNNSIDFDQIDKSKFTNLPMSETVDNAIANICF